MLVSNFWVPGTMPGRWQDGADTYVVALEEVTEDRSILYYYNVTGP